MKKVFFGLVGLVFLVSCTSKYDSLLEKIKSLEEKVRTQAIPDKADGGKLVASYIEFADAFPEDSLTPTMLFNASRVSFALNDPETSLSVLKRLTDAYSESKPIADAYVFYGFIYETVYQDFEAARYWYELFLLDFPQHEMSEDVKVTLQNLGKTPEELVAEFQKNAEENKSE